tara:strand:+ start:957 stop:1421 length:465 start_codon:yes stop_codon:yes gene_type:complete
MAFCSCFLFAVFSSAFGQKPGNESTLTSSGSVTNNQLASGLLSAFFGLDNALPFRANLLCLGASGLDGMPVVLSRTLYEVTVTTKGSIERRVNPAALGDLGDGDNNHLLCLETEDVAVSVRFPAGYLADPNLDLNPDTSVKITSANAKSSAEFD